MKQFVLLKDLYSSNLNQLPDGSTEVIFTCKTSNKKLFKFLVPIDMLHEKSELVDALQIAIARTAENRKLLDQLKLRGLK